MELCKVCNKMLTNTVFNINFKAVHICCNCEYAIVKQSIIEIYTRPHASESEDKHE